MYIFPIFLLVKYIKSSKGGDRMPQYLSYKQAMEYMGLRTYDTLKLYINQGLPVVKIGHAKRISKDAIDKFMDDHTVVISQDK